MKYALPVLNNTLKNLNTWVANCCEDREDVIHNNIETRDRLVLGAKNRSNALHPTGFSNSCSQYLTHRFKIFSSTVILKNIKSCWECCSKLCAYNNIKLQNRSISYKLIVVTYLTGSWTSLVYSIIKL